MTRKEKIEQGIEKPIGNRKRRAKEERLERDSDVVRAKLKNFKASPRKVRLVANQIRGKYLTHALNILNTSSKGCSRELFKLLRSAQSNWVNRYEEDDSAVQHLYIKEIYVDPGSMMKRIRPAPQGRAYRIRKRSNHVTVVLDSYDVV